MLTVNQKCLWIVCLVLVFSLSVAAVPQQVYAQGEEDLAKKLLNHIWADSPDSGAEGWGFKTGIVFLLPK